MTPTRERLAAWMLIAVSIVGLIPVQWSIDQYRNTFRVTMYPGASDAEVQAVAERLSTLGLDPVIEPTLNAEGQEVWQVSATIPRSEWGQDHYKYIVAVQNLRRVAAVLPGMNEQGLPLQRIQELNIQDVGILVMAALIGGFRKSAANLVWLQADANWMEGRAYRTVPLANAVTTLDPNFVEAWTVTSWHLAYNMSVEAPNPDEAADLIRQGIEFAEKGLAWNGTRYELYQEIGWTYYDKVQNYERAAEYFKKAIAHPHPPYLERLIAHAYERIPDIPAALFWYNVSLKKYGDEDPVSPGAIKTINERYVEAWDHFAEGDYDKAEVALKRNWQADDPYDTIGMHFLARIHEARAAKASRDGDQEATEEHYRQAFETWKLAAENSGIDRLARRRAMTLATNWGWLDEVPQGWNDVGLPDRWAGEVAPEHGRAGTAPADDDAAEAVEATPAPPPGGPSPPPSGEVGEPTAGPPGAPLLPGGAANPGPDSNVGPPVTAGP